MGRWLDWRNNGFEKYRMEAVDTPGVSNECFFHAILYAFYIPYRTKRDGKLEIEQSVVVQQLRKDLAVTLGMYLNDGKTVYQHLSRGKLEEISKTLPEYSLKAMQKRLMSAEPIGLEFIELISNVLEKDIIILDSARQDVYVMERDDGMLYQGRDTVVILYNRPILKDGIGHYETVGLRNRGKLETHFSADHSLVKFLRGRNRSI